MSKRLTTQVLAWVIFGVVALVIITAILASAVTAAQVAGELRTATGQLNDIRQADAKAEAARVAARSKTQDQLASLQRHAVLQSAQDRAQRVYLARLTKALRSHGIAVPSPPRVTVTASPKVRQAAPRRHPTSPGTPTPTAPNPNPDLYCLLVPALCAGLPLSLPTTLP